MSAGATNSVTRRSEVCRPLPSFVVCTGTKDLLLESEENASSGGEISTGSVQGNAGGGTLEPLVSSDSAWVCSAGSAPEDIAETKTDEIPAWPGVMPSATQVILAALQQSGDIWGGITLENSAVGCVLTG